MKLSYLALTSFLSSTATSLGVAAEDEPSASFKPAPNPTQSSNTPTDTTEEPFFPTTPSSPTTTFSPTTFSPTMDMTYFPTTTDSPTYFPTTTSPPMTYFPTEPSSFEMTEPLSFGMSPDFTTMDTSFPTTMDTSFPTTMDTSFPTTMDSTSFPTTMYPSTEPTSSNGSCVNTEFKLIPDEEKGTEMFCGGVLNQLFAPPQDVEELKEKCNTRIKSTDPNNDMVLVSELCPTFCNFDTCCSVDGDFEFLLDDGKTKRCGGLLNALIEDSTAEGKVALAEQCAAELNAVSGGTAVVEDICTGLCRKGCEVVDCNNKRPDQFLLIPDDSNGNMLNCDEFLKDMSTVEKKTVCKEKISIFNVNKDKVLKKKQTPKKTCPLYCSNRCKKQLALTPISGPTMAPAQPTGCSGPTTAPTLPPIPGPTTASAQPTEDVYSPMAQALLDKHNEQRGITALGNTGSQPAATNMVRLQWDEDLAEASTIWAETCNWFHDELNPNGENLAMSMSSMDDIYNLETLLSGVTDWYNEHVDYNYDTLGCTGVCGHYTQNVWATTTKVGCGWAECNGTDDWAFSVMLVCRYSPMGNWNGEQPYEKANDASLVASDCPSDYVGNSESGLCVSVNA